MGRMHTKHNTRLVKGNFFFNRDEELRTLFFISQNWFTMINYFSFREFYSEYVNHNRESYRTITPVFLAPDTNPFSLISPMEDSLHASLPPYMSTLASASGFVQILL